MLVFSLFWPATQFCFLTYDDGAYVTDNPHILGGLTIENIQWAAFHVVSGNWHPLTLLSHMLDCQLYGTNPWGHHLTSILLHAANAMLVFVLLHALTGAKIRSFLVTILFAFHPLRIESVAWVSERKDVLSGFFGLMTLIFYVRYARAERQPDGFRTHNYLLALFFFALGLMSKPMLVTWPFVFFLLDFWPLQRCSLVWSWSRTGPTANLLLEKVPFVVLSGLASVVTLFAQHQAGAIMDINGLPLVPRCGNALISINRYLGKLLWPVDLAAFYPHPGQWPVPLVQVAAASLGIITGIAGWQWRERPYLVMGWLWFCVMLLPVIGLVQVGEQSMADRYTYLPSLGILIALVWAGDEFLRHRPFLLPFAWICLTVAVIACVKLTNWQIGFWRDSETLFSHALAVTRNNHVAHYGLGSTLYLKGRTQEGITHLEEAIRLKPGYVEAHSDLGAALDKLGRSDDAIRHIQEAIRLRPNDAFPHFNLGAALDKQGKTDEAIQEYEEALRLKPDDGQAHINLGTALGKRGKLDEAFHHLTEAVRLEPESDQAHLNLGAALEHLGRYSEAIHHYQAAIRLKPKNAETFNNLGYLWATQGTNLVSARALIQRAVEMKPQNADFLDSLSFVLVKLNQPQAALDCQLKAIAKATAPYPALYDHLGDIYVALHQTEKAATAWRKSLSIDPNPAVQKKLEALLMAKP